MSTIGNQFRTVLLLSILSFILLAIGSIWGTQGLIIGLIFALVMNIGSYWFSDKIVLAMYRAKPVTKDSNPELYNIVKEVAESAKLPMPKVYIIPSGSPNAFATGRNPKHAAVAFTQGIMQLLSKEELKGVIAHEMAHVKNRDILVNTIAVTIASVIGYIALVARWGAIFGFGGRDRNGGSNIIQLLVIGILMPIIATIIRLAISRSREYLADETGAKIINDPHALAAALEKLNHGVSHHPMEFGSKETASMFIVTPFSSRQAGSFFLSVFSTHPPLDKRINKLKNM